MPASRNDWERVGRLLAARRVEISARYANRRAFSNDTGVGWRTLYDAEAGRRDTFKPETVRAFETAYRLVPGSLDRSLAGAPLEPLPALSAVPPLPSIPDDGDDIADEVIAILLEKHPDRDFLRKIWALQQPRVERLDLLRGWLHRDDPDPSADTPARRGSGN